MENINSLENLSRDKRTTTHVQNYENKGSIIHSNINIETNIRND